MALKKSFFALVFLIALLSPLAFSIGLSPASVAVEDVLVGGYAEKKFMVYNTEPATFVFSFKVEGELAEWASVYPQDTFVVDAGQTQEVKVVIQPPADAAPGSYHGDITASSRLQTPSFLEGASAEIQAGVVGQLLLGITKSQKQGLSVLSVELNAIEERMPGFLTFEMANTGNVRVRPLISVEIMDSRGRLLQTISKQDTEILPTKSVTLLMQLPTEDLPAGDYAIKIGVSLAGETIFERVLAQKILAIGSLSRRGQIIEIKAPPWVQQGGYAKIEVLFRNLGTLASSAKLSGEILVDGKPVAPIDSDEIDVLPGQQVTLTTYYTPNTPGRHDVRIAVLFGGKLTDYIVAAINVNPDANAQAQATARYGPWVGLAILLAIAATTYAYRKKIPKIKITKWS